MLVVWPYNDTFEGGDQINFMFAAAICANSFAVNAVPCVIATCGAYKQFGGVVDVPSFANSPSDLASMPSPAWIRYASVLPDAKFAHAPDGFDGGYSALVWIVSVAKPDSRVSIDRAIDAKHPELVPGKPTMLVVPATRPLSSPHLSTSQRRLPADVPYGVCAHHAGLPCASLTRNCFVSS